MVSATSFQFPPLDYSCLFLDLVNFHMHKNPSFPIFVYADEEAPYSLTEISFLEFGRASHRVAHALRPSRKGSDGEIVMIIANTDTVLYQAVFAGLCIAGWVPFPVSPRNSVAAVVHLMKETDCMRIVTLDHIHRSFVDSIRREHGGTCLVIYELPTLEYAYPRLGKEAADDEFAMYPPPQTRPDLDSPAMYLHSSGSTGFPKPIAHSYRIQVQWMAQPLNRLYCDLATPRRIGSMAVPSFHVFGIIICLYVPIACLVTAVVYPPRTRIDPLALPVIPTSDNIINCIKKTGCGVLFTVPAFLEQMVRSEEAIEVLKKLRAVRFGSGPLAIKVGDALCAAGVPLYHDYGATEIGVPACIAQKQDVAEGDWVWMRFANDLDIRWAPQGDGSYELQILSTRDRRMAVENLPDVKGYATSDLFVKHPTKENLWKIIGRVDDVIVLASGEKTVPAVMESVIGSHPLIQGAVMFGRERDQVGILIEPRVGHTIDVENEKAVAAFRNEIWPVVEEANASAPAFSRIFKEMILIVRGDKPLVRTAKGSIQRKVALAAYEGEINALYDTVGASLTNGLGPMAWTGKLLSGWLLEQARSIVPGNCVDPGRDLFSQGFDSLSATFLRNRILGALRISSDPEIKRAASSIPLNVVFENPTIQLLSSRIASLVNGGACSQPIDLLEEHKRGIEAMIEKYSVGLDEDANGLSSNSPLIEPAVVLVTGTTGRLGSFLLAELIRHPGVKRIFVFNRPSYKMSIEERHKSAFRDGGLSLDLLDSDKIVHIEADASLEKCGLPLEQYKEIRNSVTMIIHNAWRLDFNLAISSFEEHVRASRNLVDLGRSSLHRQGLRFLFTSSVGSAQNWNNSKGAFPEDIQVDPLVAVGTGYGESKYVVERVIAKSDLHATSLRIGQIAGGPGGIWATTDWFPILVKSSVALGVLPEAIDVVSWLRQEDVASVVLETAFAKEPPPPAMNIVNPQSTPWSSIMSSVRRSIVAREGLSENALPIVRFGEWFELLESRAKDASAEDLEKMPAIKLLEFFRTWARRDGDNGTEAVGRVSFDTVRARQTCATMARMQGIGEAEVDAWIGYWISQGAI